VRIMLSWALLALTTQTALSAEPISLKIYSAGSLRQPLTKIIQAYTAAYGTPIDVVFGASGPLAKRLSEGEQADLLTSADRGGPEMPGTSGKAGPTVTFAGNRLCAVVRPGLKTSTATILNTLLDPSVHIGDLKSAGRSGRCLRLGHVPARG
jgi:molybdate transport system substrate-binding protein